MPVILSPLSTICEYSEERILTPRKIPTKKNDGPNHDSIVFAMIVRGYFEGGWKTPEDLDALYGCDFIRENDIPLLENFIKTMDFLDNGKRTMFWDGSSSAIKPKAVTPDGGPGSAEMFRYCFHEFLIILENIQIAEAEGGI